MARIASRVRLRISTVGTKPVVARCRRHDWSCIAKTQTYPLSLYPAWDGSAFAGCVIRPCDANKMNAVHAQKVQLRSRRQKAACDERTAAVVRAGICS